MERSYQSTFFFLSPSGHWTEKIIAIIKKQIKMKKYLSLIAFAMMAVVSLSLTGCGDDDDDNGGGSSALVGTWDLISLVTDREG